MNEFKITEVRNILDTSREKLTKLFENFNKATAETFAWLAVIIFCCATVPSFLAMKAGLSDKTPSLDMVALVWVGLLLYFVRSVILKDMINVITIGFGFALQALLLGFIFFV